MVKLTALVKLTKNKKKEKEALSYGMLCAERLTRLKAYKIIAEILVSEAKKYPERQSLANRFLRNYLPEMKKEAAFIKSNDKTTLTLLHTAK